METIQDRKDTDIGEYVAILRRRWIWVAAAMVIAIVISLALSLNEPKRYEASAQLLLQSKQSESVFSTGAVAGDPERMVQNELRIINSRAIAQAVAKAYGEPIAIAAVSGGDDDVIILSATDTDPKVAAKKVNVYAETYQNQRLTALIADLSKSKTVIQQQIDDFQSEVDAVNKPIAELDAKILATLTTDPGYNDLVRAREQLVQSSDAKRSELQAQLNEYQQRLQILQLSERLTTTGGVQILNPATTPSTPISPNPTRDAFQAALIGLFVGIGVSFLLEQVDDRIRAAGDLERAVPSVPVLGLIPYDDAWKDRSAARLSSLVAPMSATAEAFRGLRTSLQYLALQRPIRVVQITSATSGEGKSSTLANLAVAFAEAGMRVAIVGCDLRKPRTHQFFDVDGAIGLTSVLLNTNTLEECLQISPLHPNVTVLASGPRPPNPSELLGLDSTRDLIHSLLHTHNIVFLDCPPVLPVTDSLVLARCTDATLFLAQSQKTSRRMARHSVERLHQVDSPLIGTILNGVSAEQTYGSLFDYYGYTDTPERPLLRRFRRGRKSDVPALDTSVLPEQGGRPQTPAHPEAPQYQPTPPPIPGRDDPATWTGDTEVGAQK